MRIDGPQITGSFNLNGGTVGDLQVFVTTSSLNNLTASVATTGSNLFNGTQTLSGSIIPAVNNTYDLGSPTNQFRHVYISSGSLYVNGTKVLGSTSQELQITTDAGQSFKILEAGSDTITLQSADGNITLAASGGGDVILDPTTGVIGLKGTVTIYTGNKITSSDGNSIQFGNGIAVTGSIVSTVTPLISGSAQISGLGFATTGSNTFNGNLTVTGYIDAQELRTTYISSSILYRSGSTKFGDDLLDTHAFTGSLLVSGTISVPGSGLVSGSSQVSYTGLTNVPSGLVSGSSQILNGSGVWSGSAQLPSGIVSGSSQVLNASGILSGSGTQNSLLIWNNAAGTTLGDSKISQPDGNNVRINHGDQYTLGANFTYNSTYVTSLTLGRTNTGSSSNTTFIYDIANTEVFEIRRNYSANTFKITLNNGTSIVDHLTMSSAGATTFVDNITITNGARPYFVAKTTNSGEEAGIKFQQSTVSDWYFGTAQGTPSAQDLGIRDVKNGRVPLYFSSSTGAGIFGNNVGIGCVPQAILDVSHTAGTTNIIRVSNGAGNYRWRVDQNFSMIMTNASGTDTFSVTTSGSISTPAQYTSYATAPLSFQANGNTGTYTQTTIYANQNNTSGDIANGIFIERGYTDTSNTELRQFVIGARGGSYQWKLSGPGGTFQRDSCEVKLSGDGDLFVGRYSAGAAKVFRVYQASADGYLELQTGAGDIVTKLSGYGGTPCFTTTNFGFGKSTGISYKIDAASGGGQVARFTTTQSGAGVGQCAEFINSSGSGYASWIYIGSAPGTDWKIGKNISNSANTTYHFEIVDSSNNLRMQINNGTGNVTFSGSVTQNSDIRLKKNIRDIDGALNKILQTRGVLYDRIDTTATDEIGFIAQELEMILPELVTTSDLDVKSIKYQNLGPILVEAIKELKLENDNLKDILSRNNIS